MRHSSLLFFSLIVAQFLCASTSGREIRVSSVGFDADDSTRFIQSALDSGAERVILDRQRSPWVTRPLRGASRQTLVLEAGVELVAKQGEFHGSSDVLLSYNGAEDVAIIGHGACIRMRHADYVAAPYGPSEWRHALSFLSCRKVRVEGVTIRDSGGDGIYIGCAKGKSGSPCEEFVIRDVRCERNHRQGISVISVRNLLIERCRLNGTKGTPPAAGIDFEPNSPDQVLAGIVVRDCEMNGNEGDGIDLSLHMLRASSQPIDLLIEDCNVDGNFRGFAFSQIFRDVSCVGGQVTLRRCKFSRSRFSGLDFQRKPEGSAKVYLEDCRVADCCTDLPELADVRFSSIRRSDPPPASVSFVNLEIVSPVDRRPVVFSAAGWATQEVNAVSGVITHRSPSGVRTTIVDRAWCNNVFSPVRPAVPVHAVPVFDERTVVDQMPGEMLPVSPFGLRRRIEYVFHSKAAGICRFEGGFHRLGGAAEVRASVRVRSLDGTTLMTKSILEDYATFGFKAPNSGFYILSIEVARCSFVMEKSNVPIGIYLTGDDPRNILYTTSTCYFHVSKPKPFQLSVSGEPVFERIGVAVIDPDGNEFWKKASVAESENLRIDEPKVGLWSVRFSPPSTGVLEDYSLDITGVPPVLFLTKLRYWR